MAVSGSDIVEAARKEIGDPYVWGTEGPNSFDCSGLVQYVFGTFGIRTPRVTGDQVKFGTAVQRKDIQLGDLVFTNWSGKPHSHVGIYAGNNVLINAPGTGKKVREQKMTDSYWAHVDAIRRFPGVVGGPSDSGIDDWLKDKVGSVLGGPTDAMASAAGALKDIATSIASVGKVAELVTKMFLPNNILRGVSGFLGFIFLLLGLWFIAREAQQ